MKRKLLALGIIVGILLILTSCGLDTKIKLYVRDIMDIADGKENEFTVQAVLKIEGISKDKFEEDKDKIIQILSSVFINREHPRFEEKDYSDYLVLDIEVPITNGAMSDKSIFTVAASKDKDAYKVKLLVNDKLFAWLNNELRNEYFYTLDVSNFNMEIQLSNDLRKDVNLYGYALYINGKPLPKVDGYVLERRRDAILTFSNVLRDALFSQKSVDVVWIK